MDNKDILLCTTADFNRIIADIEDFWGSDRTLAYHHPMFVNEFGNTAFVIKYESVVIAYLFGLISQKEPCGYVHLIGVRQNFQKRGLGKKLYHHFIDLLKQQEISEIKAITTPTNETSIKFHMSLGMTMLGTENENGVKVIKDYSGWGQDRVVFKMRFA